MSSSFDWNQFEKVSPPPPEVTPQPSTPSSDFNWEQFERAGPLQKPTTSSEIERHIKRTGARVAETLGGLPGDIFRLPEKAAKYITSKFSPETASNIESALNMTRGLFPGTNLPTSQQLREKTKTATQGSLEPQTRGERISDEIASDFASLAIPIKGKVPFLNTIGRALGISAFGVGAGEAAKELGAGETGQTATKIGAMFLGSIFNPKGASKYVSNLYSEAKQSVPQGATVDAKNLSNNLSSLGSQLRKGGTANSKTKPLQKIGEIQSKISKGRIPVEELTEFKKTINEARAGLYEEFKSDKIGRKLAKKNLDSVSKVVDDSLQEYAKANPQWGKLYNEANQGYGAIAQSRKASEFVGRIINQYPNGKYLALAAELFLAPKTIPISIAGYGLLKSSELLARIAKSPVLRKYYTAATQAAIKEDAAAFSKNMEKLSSQLEEKD